MSSHACIRYRASLIAVAVLTLTCSLAAAVPTVLREQGYLEQGGTPVTGDVTLTFRLYDGFAAVTPFWQESQIVACDNGYFTALLGQSMPIDPADLAASSELYLGVAVEGGAELTPRGLVVSEPYALAAAQADVAEDLNCTGCVAAHEVGFSYAASMTAGGPAQDLECSGSCVSTAELANGSVTTAKLADGAVTAPKVGFVYAGSSSFGGPAIDVECSEACVGTFELDNGGVTGAKIAIGAVTGTHLAIPLTAGALTINSATDVTINRLALTDLSTGSATEQVCRSPTNSNRLGVCSSSLRYKRDIEPLPGGLDVVEHLRPVSFAWKQGGAPDVGFVAEEVASVEPRLAALVDGRIEGVRFNQLLPFLVKAVQEQQAQLREQQEQIRALQAQVARLQAGGAAPAR